MIIRKKVDIQSFVNSFSKYANNDGTKYYFVIDDKKRDGIITIMMYDDGSWTIHRKGEGYCDPEETKVESDELIKLIWQNRWEVNRVLKTATQNATEMVANV